MKPNFREFMVMSFNDTNSTAAPDDWVANWMDALLDKAFEEKAPQVTDCSEFE